MTDFELDERLAKDSFVLGELDVSLLLLMNNKLAPWFVLVPKVAEISELYELDKDVQLSLLNEINVLSEFIKQQFVVDKLNVAAIGNIVNQLHVHVVGRSHSDPCWPGVVWGADSIGEYTQQETEELIKKLRKDVDGFSG